MIRCSSRIAEICGIYSSVSAFCKAMVEVEITVGRILPLKSRYTMAARI